MPPRRLRTTSGGCSTSATAARAARDWDRGRCAARRARRAWAGRSRTAPAARPRGRSCRPCGDTGYAELATASAREPPTVAASLQLVAEEHPDDLERAAEGPGRAPARRRLGARRRGQRARLRPRRDPRRRRCRPAPVVLRTRERLGWADARTLGMRRSPGEVTVLLDTSLEPTGDFVSPLLAAFDDPTRRHRRRLGRDERRRREFERSAARRGRRGRGLLPRGPARGAPRGRRLRPPLPLLPQRRP